MAKRKAAKKPAKKKSAPRRPGRPKAATRPPSLASLRRLCFVDANAEDDAAVLVFVRGGSVCFVTPPSSRRPGDEYPSRAALDRT